MKAEELMIGDWVYSSFADVPCKVISIDTIINGFTSVQVSNVKWKKDIVSLSPIPITPEILEKNGFSDDYRNYDYNLSYAQSCGDIIGVAIYGRKAAIEDMDFKYVHELQHALRLCGIEKEIVL